MDAPSGRVSSSTARSADSRPITAHHVVGERIGRDAEQALAPAAAPRRRRRRLQPRRPRARGRRWRRRRPSSASSAATAPPRTAKLSAPASSAMPPTSCRATVPPQAVGRLEQVTGGARRCEPAGDNEARDAAADDGEARGRREGDAQAMRVDELHDARQHGRVGVGRNAVAEVEHVGARSTAALQHVAGRAPRAPATGAQQRRVDVALQRHVGADTPRGLVERQAPIDADRVDADVAHRREQLAGADAEVHERHAELAD